MPESRPIRLDKKEPENSADITPKDVTDWMEANPDHCPYHTTGGQWVVSPLSGADRYWGQGGTLFVCMKQVFTRQGIEPPDLACIARWAGKAADDREYKKRVGLYLPVPEDAYDRS